MIAKIWVLKSEWVLRTCMHVYVARAHIDEAMAEWKLTYLELVLYLVSTTLPFADFMCHLDAWCIFASNSFGSAMGAYLLVGA